MGQDLLHAMMENHHTYYNFLFSLIGNPEDTWDVLQNIYLKLLSTDLDAGNNMSYLYSLCKNTALNFLRDRKETVPLEQLDNKLAMDNKAELWDFMYIDLIRSCLGAIPPDVRRPLEENLRYGMSPASLSRKYGISRKKLRYWRNVFLERIKKFL